MEPTGSKEEQKATKVKASAFLDQIQQGMTHDVNTHVCLRELKDIVARLGEDPQDLIACIKTLMDRCEMINDEHREHELHCHIICAYHHEGKLLGKLMAKPFKTPSNELADIAVNHFTIQHAREQVVMACFHLLCNGYDTYEVIFVHSQYYSISSFVYIVACDLYLYLNITLILLIYINVGEYHGYSLTVCKSLL